MVFRRASLQACFVRRAEALPYVFVVVTTKPIAAILFKQGSKLPQVGRRLFPLDKDMKMVRHETKRPYFEIIRLCRFLQYVSDVEQNQVIVEMERLVSRAKSQGVSKTALIIEALETDSFFECGSWHRLIARLKPCPTNSLIIC